MSSSGGGSSLLGNAAAENHALWADHFRALELLPSSFTSGG